MIAGNEFRIRLGQSKGVRFGFRQRCDVEDNENRDQQPISKDVPGHP